MYLQVNPSDFVFWTVAHGIGSKIRTWGFPTYSKGICSELYIHLASVSSYLLSQGSWPSWMPYTKKVNYRRFQNKPSLGKAAWCSALLVAWIVLDSREQIEKPGSGVLVLAGKKVQGQSEPRADYVSQGSNPATGINGWEQADYSL